ncbi:HLA class II histocompatibility antigen gamma chain isoform X1 [Bufo bufo]|uniref:HLA class II histocompatibility antigen gamma chain isoform X1 n=1 Tax=Bufo bufo TaxID=8384 RepID=UPI001ABDDCD3|nr:HLA class II histocompatibility antigen gamma chain isoform X1 [Bufo bufo]
MAEETQNLVQEEMPAENSITVGSTETRTITCNKRNVVPALSIFVALLIAGQAVSVYFITQQQGKINELDTTTRDMKLKEMIDKLPGSPPSQNRQKLRMSTFNIPLAVRDDDGTQQKLENKAMASNHVEDAVQYMLLMGNPLRNYPSFNGTILENLKKLRKTLSYQEWMLFDSWMQQWYLFYLVQSSKAPETTPEPNADISTGSSVPQERNLPAEFEESGNLVYASTNYTTDSMPSFIDEIPSGAPVMTLCQLTAKRHSLPGAYVPQCDSNGDFTPMQCWHSTGYCWCVYRNGTEVEGTRARVKIDCSVINESMDAMEDY